MNDLIALAEQYWGYALIGGVSVGSLFSMVVGVFKLISTLRNKDATLAEAVAEVKALNTKSSETTQENEELKKVQAVTFQILTYLVVASKMDVKDKTALLNSVLKLTEAPKEFVETTKIEATTVVTETVEQAKDLLDQLTAGKV